MFEEILFTICREDGTTVIIQQAEGGEMVIAEDTLEQSIESDTPLHIATDGTVQVVSTEEEQVSTHCQFAKIANGSFINYVLMLYKIYVKLFVYADFEFVCFELFQSAYSSTFHVF